MKKIKISILFTLISIGINAQRVLGLTDKNYIGAYEINVGFSKTSHLIFPFTIAYVDLGSEDIIAEKVEKVENILKIKANSANFPQTNLTVLTNDGKYYSFLVSYKEKPDELSIVLNDKANNDKGENFSYSGKPTATFENIHYTYPELENFSKWVISRRRSINNIGSVRNEISFSLNGMYIKENAFFFHLFIKNISNINYDIDFIKFYIRDKKIIKRTSRQEIEIFPAFVYDQTVFNNGTIYGMKDLQKVFVLEKFTIPEDKTLEIELFEKKGGRHMAFSVTNEDIIHARLLKLKR